MMQRDYEEGEDLFLDAYDHRSSIASTSSEELDDNCVSYSRRFGYDFWMAEPMSVQERRNKFFQGVGFPEFVLPQSLDTLGNKENAYDLERITESSGATLDPLSSSGSEIACDDPFCCIKDLDSGKKFIIQGSELQEVGSERLMTLQEFETCLGLSSSVQRFMRREISLSGQSQGSDASGQSQSSDASDWKKKKYKQWWKHLKMKRYPGGTCNPDPHSKLPRMVRVKIHQQQKRFLEFSALYMGQEIKAHNGLIRTMKFCPTGRYLASGGADCVVRIWEVREVEPLCKCHMTNVSSKYDDKAEEWKLSGGKSYGSAPIVIPKKVVMIQETPVHEFHGHLSEILDLTWSISDLLLTSSKDKTVRMWKVGFHGCLKAFQHNDYVTCIQFNPIDERYFISGSIDGKVRIWGIPGNRVVDWVDTRDIVTSICYQPDGKGFVIGSISGDCRFYVYPGDSIELDKHLCFQGRKKSAVKPITGLQFSPKDYGRVMVQSFDSKLRIYDDADVVRKFRGLRKCKSQSSSSFTSDGRHIVSVGDDSHVYIWNYKEGVISSSKSAKSTRACEHFYSECVSVAVPWPGLEQRDTQLSNEIVQASSASPNLFEPSTWIRDPDCFSLGIWLFIDASSRVSPTWSEVPASNGIGRDVHEHHKSCRPDQKFQHAASVASAWSAVILTGSRDGFIRSFHNYGLPIRL